MIQRGVLISVVNHENTSNALSLARRFRDYVRRSKPDRWEKIVHDSSRSRRRPLSLGIKVGGDSEISPRTPLSAAAVRTRQAVVG